MNPKVIIALGVVILNQNTLIWKIYCNFLIYLLILGVKAQRSPHTGVWVEDNKIAAIGIHASRYVTTHGIALNCDNDLTWFDYIDPCGIEDKGVTSLSRETGVHCTIDKMAPLFLRNFEKVFGCESDELDAKMKEDILSTVYTKLLVQNA